MVSAACHADNGFEVIETRSHLNGWEKVVEKSGPFSLTFCQIAACSGICCW